MLITSSEPELEFESEPVAALLEPDLPHPVARPNAKSATSRIATNFFLENYPPFLIMLVSKIKVA